MTNRYLICFDLFLQIPLRYALYFYVNLQTEIQPLLGSI